MTDEKMDPLRWQFLTEGIMTILGDFRGALKDTPWGRMMETITLAHMERCEAHREADVLFLNTLRSAIVVYGQEVDPEGFDELGQPRQNGSIKDPEEAAA